MSELTDWFPPEIKPKYAGVYEVDYADDDGRAVCYWNGKDWMSVKWEGLGAGFLAACNRAKASKDKAWSAHVWRGLANNPKKGKK